MGLNTITIAPTAVASATEASGVAGVVNTMVPGAARAAGTVAHAGKSVAQQGIGTMASSGGRVLDTVTSRNEVRVIAGVARAASTVASHALGSLGVCCFEIFGTVQYCEPLRHTLCRKSVISPDLRAIVSK